jgi:anti-sigma regulatory factor (Ser/Thr protein kinase)
MLPPLQTVEVHHSSDVGEARRAARTIADTLGFALQACEEIAIAMTELATNLIKHAHGGKLILTPLTAGGRKGLEIKSEDNGPGIADVERAIGDRFSTAGTLGTGLGAVNRLMDELEIDSHRGSGTRIVCRKWLRVLRPSLRPCPLAFGVATRPRPSCDLNGDAFVVAKWSESALVGLIDGLGHGQFAHRAALSARNYVEGHYDLPLDQIFLGTGRACRTTRGVVMALARFDWGEGRLVFASIGNIEARVFPKASPFRFIIRRGVIGLNAPRPVAVENPWPFDHVLVLHSDGISTHWDWKDLQDWENRPASEIANELLKRNAKESDDATVIVVRSVVP